MDEIKNLIDKNNFLNAGDKDFLYQQLTTMNPIDKLRLKHSLLNNQQPAVLQNLQLIRDKFNQRETPKSPDLLTRVVQKVFKPASPKIVSVSFLNQPVLLGGYVPKAPVFQNIQSLMKLKEIISLSQLRTVTANHINFTLNDNAELEIQSFFDKIETLLDKFNDINERRNQYMYFISSPLFNSYIETGLTALRHPELQPTSIILNTLYQIDSKYLNGKQFRFASAINNHLRSLCGI